MRDFPQMSSASMTPAEAPNNPGVIQPQASDDSQASNNSGQSGFNPDSFWDNPAGVGDQQTQQENPHANLGQQIVQSLQGLKLGDGAGLFNQEVTAELEQGNYNGLNQRFNGMMQDVAKQTLMMTLQMMKALRENMVSDMDSRFASQITANDDTKFLEDKFPSAKNPAMAPVVKRVWDQALTLSKGNRGEAEKTTRIMLAEIAKGMGVDSGLNPPADPRGSTGTLVGLEQMLSL